MSTAPRELRYTPLRLTGHASRTLAQRPMAPMAPMALRQGALIFRIQFRYPYP